MRRIYKRLAIVLLDIALFVYVIFAMVSFNKPDETKRVCSEVNISIDDENANGFLSAAEVKKILEDHKMYPLNAKIIDVKPRRIEELLCESPFVKTAECYKTRNNHVFISITQRLPIIRIKSANGADYYIDDNGGVMPNSKYSSDLIVVTGNVNQWLAKNYIAPMAATIMGNDLWKNLIEQINITQGGGVEIVPRLGNHIVFLGNIPQTKYVNERKKVMENFVKTKLTRLQKFYTYGLSQVGWNKYSYINLEFDNQIICKKN